MVRYFAGLRECFRQLVHVVYLQEGAGAGLVEALDAAQLPADGPAADADELVQLFVGLAQTLLHLGEALPELVELRLHRAQQLPDLTGALLDGEGLEAHLQAVQQGRHGAGACHVDLIVPLQDLQQPRVHHLGIQALKGQEQDAERRGIGRLDVLFPDVFGLAAEHQLEGAAGILHGLRVAGSVGVL